MNVLMTAFAWIVMALFVAFLLAAATVPIWLDRKVRR